VRPEIGEAADGSDMIRRYRLTRREAAGIKLSAGLPASGRSFTLSGIDIFEFVDGQVVQHWHETDHLELFTQLGAELRPRVDA
jgi:predicted ester cyclase